MGTKSDSGCRRRSSHGACLRRVSSRIALRTFLLAPLFLSGCWFYSFSGSAIPAHLSTIAVPLFDDVSRSGQPDLSELLVEKLIDRFVRQTRLTLEDDEEAANAVLSGRVDSYRNEPVSVTGQERAALNRVTIRVTVVYHDRVEDREVLNRAFTAFGEYDPVADGFDGEIAALQQALESIAGDIFTAATSDW